MGASGMAARGVVICQKPMKNIGTRKFLEMQKEMQQTEKSCENQDGLL